MRASIFSCVVPVKGTRQYLSEALESLSAQGIGDDLEIIIQDGDIVPDSGQSDALNKGFAKAKGEWLFWLNADDILLPGALKKIRALISSCAPSTSDEVTQAPSTSAAKPHESTLSWIAGDTVYIDEKGLINDVRTDAKWRPWFGKKLSVWTGGPSAFFRRELWGRCGGFDTSLKFVMDIDLWTRWAQAGVKFARLNDYIWGFREHDSSLTGNGVNRTAQLAELSRVDDRYGVSSTGFWRNVTRAASVLDGSWIKRRRDTARFHGKHWSEMFR